MIGITMQVQELSQVEMMEIDGGADPLTGAVVALAIAIVGAFSAGWKAGAAAAAE